MFFYWIYVYNKCQVDSFTWHICPSIIETTHVLYMQIQSYNIYFLSWVTKCPIFITSLQKCLKNGQNKKKGQSFPWKKVFIWRQLSLLPIFDWIYARQCVVSCCWQCCYRSSWWWVTCSYFLLMSGRVSNVFPDRRMWKKKSWHFKVLSLSWNIKNTAKGNNAFHV